MGLCVQFFDTLILVYFQTGFLQLSMQQKYEIIVFSRIKPSDVNIDESELKEFLDEHENYFSELISEYIRILQSGFKLS